MKARSWNDLVVAGRAAAEQEQGARWVLGDLANEVAPADRSAEDGRLARYADEIRVSYDALETYRRTSAAWPVATRIATVTWSIYRELESRPDRVDILAGIVKTHGDRPTVNQAREFLGKKSAGVRSTSSVKERAREVTRHMADPEVAKEVLRDPVARRTVHAAQAAVQDEGLIRNRPGYARVQRELEIVHADFFRSLAAIGGAGFLSSLRSAAGELALLAEHDVAVPGDVMDAAYEQARTIRDHLDVLALRAGLESWGVRTHE